MMKRQSTLSAVAAIFLAGAIGLAACASPATQAPAATSAPAATAAPADTSAPAATQAPAPTQAPTAAAIQVSGNAALGKFLTDGAGMTLYLYTKDAPDTSNCYDKCAQAWPPLLAASGQPVLKDGVDAGLIGTTQRKDGTTQITYNKWPLYYFDKDKASGDVNGQAVGKVWWVVSGEGNPIKPAGLQVVQSDKLGKFLADGNGRALYLYTKDSKDVTNCYGKCEVFWPPLLSVGQPNLATGVDSSLFGTVQRKDGSSQVTYNGWPLYYFDKDVLPGDVNGQGSQNVWYVIAPDGQTIN